MRAVGDQSEDRAGNTAVSKHRTSDNVCYDDDVAGGERAPSKPVSHSGPPNNRSHCSRGVRPPPVASPLAAAARAATAESITMNSNAGQRFPAFASATAGVPGLRQRSFRDCGTCHRQLAQECNDMPHPEHVLLKPGCPDSVQAARQRWQSFIMADSRIQAAANGLEPSFRLLRRCRLGTSSSRAAWGARDVGSQPARHLMLPQRVCQDRTRKKRRRDRGTSRSRSRPVGAAPSRRGRRMNYKSVALNRAR